MGSQEYVLHGGAPRRKQSRAYRDPSQSHQTHSGLDLSKKHTHVKPLRLCYNSKASCIVAFVNPYTQGPEYKAGGGRHVNHPAVTQQETRLDWHLGPALLCVHLCLCSSLQYSPPLCFLTTVETARGIRKSYWLRHETVLFKHKFKATNCLSFSFLAKSSLLYVSSERWMRWQEVSVNCNIE